MNDNHVSREKTGTFKQKLFLIVFGLVVGGAVSEVGLRIVGYSYPQFYQNYY